MKKVCSFKNCNNEFDDNTKTQRKKYCSRDCKNNSASERYRLRKLTTNPTKRQLADKLAIEFIKEFCHVENGVVSQKV